MDTIEDENLCNDHTKTIFCCFDRSSPSLQAFFALVDVDDDGTVDYDEFMTMVEHMMELAMAGSVTLVWHECKKPDY